MKFAPKSEQEIQAMALIEPGIYSFQVSGATHEKSKNGNDMIKLTLSIWDKDGGLHFVYDYLLEAMAYKLRHFCENTGLIAKYESGELTPEDCLRREGQVEIAIQDGKPKSDGGRYPDRNSVKDYIKGAASPNRTPVELEIDVPF